MASPGLRRRRRGAVPLRGSVRPPSSASSFAAASGPRPRTPPRAQTPRAVSAPAHGPLPGRASTGARRPGPPGSDRAPPPGSAAAAAAATAPWGRVASCKCPAFCKQAPALPSHPAGASRSGLPGEDRALAPVAPRALQSPGWELAARSRWEWLAGFPSLPHSSPHELLSPPGRELPLPVALLSCFQNESLLPRETLRQIRARGGYPGPSMTRPKDRSNGPASTLPHLPPRTELSSFSFSFLKCSVIRVCSASFETRSVSRSRTHPHPHPHTHSRAHRCPYPNALLVRGGITSSSPASLAVCQGCIATPADYSGRCLGAHTPPTGPKRRLPANGHTLVAIQLQPLLRRLSPKGCSNLVNEGFTPTSE